MSLLTPAVGSGRFVGFGNLVVAADERCTGAVWVAGWVMDALLLAGAVFGATGSAGLRVVCRRRHRRVASGHQPNGLK